MRTGRAGGRACIQTYAVTSTALEDAACSLLGVFGERGAVQELREAAEGHHLPRNTGNTP